MVSISPAKLTLLRPVSEDIAKDMVAFDGPQNGWRHLILPLAHSDELVMDAVLAVSASHCVNANDQPCPATLPRNGGLGSESSSHDTNNLYLKVLVGLRQRQDLITINAVDRHAVLLSLLVLMLGSMIAASKDFPVLFRMLESAVAAIGGVDHLGTGDMADFITRQVHK